MQNFTNLIKLSQYSVYPIYAQQVIIGYWTKNLHSLMMSMFLKDVFAIGLSQFNSQTGFQRKCRNTQTKLGGSIFLKSASIAPTGICVTNLPSDCPS